MATSVQTNKEFAKKDGNFISACEKAGVEATRRQASKFRNQKGSAYVSRNKKVSN